MAARSFAVASYAMPATRCGLVGCLFTLVLVALPLRADTTDPQVLARIEKLYKLEQAVKDAELAMPEWRKLRERYQANSDWYGSEDRMNGLRQMNQDLYRGVTDEKDKAARTKAFQDAKSFAFMEVIADAAASPDGQATLNDIFFDEWVRAQYAKTWKLPASTDDKQFFENLRAFFAENAVKNKAKTDLFKQGHTFITPMVWEQARKNSLAEYYLAYLEAVIELKTPPELKAIQEQIKLARRELNGTTPGWERFERTGKQTATQAGAAVATQPAK